MSIYFLISEDTISMKYLLFGTGDYYERYKKWFSKNEVIALLDNSLKKQNTIIDGIPVLAPEVGINLQYDAIIILSFYVKDMKEQLIKLGVSEKHIYHFFDLHKLIPCDSKNKPILYFDNANSIMSKHRCDNKKILLLSHDLTLGGPALALFQAATILHRQGYEIVFASMLDGQLRQQLSAVHIPTIVDVNLQVQTMKETKWVQNFDLIICNTISFYVFLADRDVTIPIIWWLHDSSFFYQGVDKNILKNIDTTNLTVTSVGPVPQKAYQDYVPNVKVENLLYGVIDAIYDKKSVEKNKSNKICFTVIGYIEERKGQDILLQAIKQLSLEYIEKVEFYFVGQNTSLLAQQIEAQIQNMPQIVMTGTVDRDKINKMLEYTDVLICPSREDPMPTVAAEAMMHKVPCILSDSVGTVTYIEDCKSGLIFENQNVDQLVEKIIWCINNYVDLPQLGIEARKVYEKVFSMKTFADNILQFVRRYI